MKDCEFLNKLLNYTDYHKEKKNNRLDAKILSSHAETKDNNEKLQVRIMR